MLRLITARGLYEFNDVIHNCLGAANGIEIEKAFVVTHLLERIQLLII